MVNLAYLTRHDLRSMADASSPVSTCRKYLERIVNRVEGARGVTSVIYNRHEFWAETRAVMELWEAELRRIVGS